MKFVRFFSVENIFVFLYSLHEFLCSVMVKNRVVFSRILLAASFFPLAGVWFPQYSKTFGSFALDVLIAILFISPFAEILRWKILLLLLGFRRQFGILFACLVISHIAGAMSYLGIENSFRFAASLSYPSALAWAIGFFSFFITFLLFITSNAFSLQILRAYWKRLHRLVYPLFFLVLLHKILLSETSDNGALSMIEGNIDSISILLLYIVLKFFAWEKPKFLKEILKETEKKFHYHRNRKHYAQ